MITFSDLIKELKEANVEVMAYADDLAIVANGMVKLKKVMRIIEKWTGVAKMRINKKKSGVMFMRWNIRSKVAAEKFIKKNEYCLM